MVIALLPAVQTPLSQESQVTVPVSMRKRLSRHVSSTKKGRCRVWTDLCWGAATPAAAPRHLVTLRRCCALICFLAAFPQSCSHQFGRELSSWKWQTRKFWLKHPLIRFFSVTCSLHQSVKLCYEKSFCFVEDFDIAKSGLVSNWNET